MPADTVVLSDWGEGAFLMWRFPELDFVSAGTATSTPTPSSRGTSAWTAPPPAGWPTSRAPVRGTRSSRPGSELAYGLQTLEGWEELQRSDTFVLLEAPDDWPTPD